MGETNEVMVFDPNALKDRIAKQVQNSFGMLIPDEAFKKLIDDHVQKFFNSPSTIQVSKKRREKPNSSNWSREYEDYFTLEAKATPFEIMVWEATNELARELLAAYLKEHQEAVKEAIISQVINANAAKINATLEDAMKGLMENRAANQLAMALLAVQTQAFENMKQAFNIAGLPDAASRLQGAYMPQAVVDTKPA